VTPTTRNLKALGYIGAVAAGAALLLGSSLGHIVRGAHDKHLLAWAVLAVLTLVAGRLSVRLPLPSCIVSVSDALIVLTVLLCGPDLATLTGALDGFAASKRARGGWGKRIFNTASVALSVGLASRLYARLAPQGGFNGPSAQVAVALLGLAVAQYAVNALLVAGAVALSEWISPAAVLGNSLAWAGTCYLAGLLIASFVFLLTRKVGVVSALAIVPAPLLLHVACRKALQKTRATTGP